MDAAPAILAQAGLAAAVGTGGVFALAGVDKLRHRALVAGVIANYRLLPAPLVDPVAGVLPWIECGLGFGLIASGISGFAPLRWLALPAAALLLLFAAAMAINIARGRRHIDCGCGHGALRQQLAPALVVRNVLLALAVMIHAIAPPAEASVAGAVLALAAGIALFLMIQVSNALTALAASPLAARK